MTGIGIDYRRVPVSGPWLSDEEHVREEDAIAEWQRSLGLAVEDVALVRRPARLEPALPETAIRTAFPPWELARSRCTTGFLAGVGGRRAKQLGATVLEETAGWRYPARGRDSASPAASACRSVICTRMSPWRTKWRLDALCSATPIGVTPPTLPVKGQLIAFANARCCVRPGSSPGTGGTCGRAQTATTMLWRRPRSTRLRLKRITGDGVAWLLGLACTCSARSLLEGEIAETWSGLRPGSETNDSR